MLSMNTEKKIESMSFFDFDKSNKT